MQFNQVLQEGRLVKRYKRFLCDVRLENGKLLTIHCPNTGSMKNCCPDNARVWFSRSDNPKRKYAHTWEMVESPAGDRIGINTLRANALVEEALLARKIPGLKQFAALRREVPYGRENSRIDFLLERSNLQRNDLQQSNKANIYIEVKSVTLLEQDGWGYFPDAVSERGQKHLRELIEIVRSGEQAILFFCVQHSGISKMKAAAHIDPDYAALLKTAKQAGVGVLAYACDFSDQGMKLSRKVKVSQDE